MRTVGIFEAKTKLSELIEAVKRGEEIRITQRGKPVARLVVDNEVTLAPENASVSITVEQLDVFAALREKLRREGKTTTIDEIIEWKNEGRR